MKRFLIYLMSIMIVAMIGCSNTSEKVDKNTFTFTGTIEEIRDTQALVLTTHEALKDDQSTGEVLVDLSVNSKRSFQVGDAIQVTAGAEILESDPPQVHTLSVELVK